MYWGTVRSPWADSSASRLRFFVFSSLSSAFPGRAAVPCQLFDQLGEPLQGSSRLTPDPRCSFPVGRAESLASSSSTAAFEFVDFPISQISNCQHHVDGSVEVPATATSMLLATPLVAGAQMHLELPLVITTVPLRQRSPLATAHFFLFRLHGRPQLRPHPHKRRTPGSRCLPGWHPSGPLGHSPPLSRGLAWLGLARSGQSSYETRRHVVKSVCVCKHMYLWDVFIPMLCTYIHRRALAMAAYESVLQCSTGESDVC